MTTPSISSLSVQYVTVPVTYTADATGDTVEFAFTTGAEPVTADWHAGSWAGSATLSGTNYIQNAQALIGPGTSFELTDGWWFVWVKVTDSPEVPVIKAGSILIT